MMLSTTLAHAQEKISFEISFVEPQAHYVEVKMEIMGNSGDQIDLKMPVWAPGSYLIREFPKNVEGFMAKGDGETLAFSKINKNTWRIHRNKSKKIEVHYRVYAFELSVRTSFVDATHAFLSPTGIFMYVDNMISHPAEITILPYSSWEKISTGLQTMAGKKNVFYAPNFDVLFDSPIEVGNQDIFSFIAEGVEHEVVMVGGGNYNSARLKEDIAKIVREETKIFGENPNKRYVFIVHNQSSGGGGLEHLNSTVLGASREAYNKENGYLNFLGLVSHEYFHLWNVKRLRPENLGPFNYDAENYTSDLWIAEGFTAYYDNLVLLRAGFLDEDAYLRVLAGDITTVENRPGNLIQSLSESSFDAWIKQYRPNENSLNTTVTYYSKGALIGMLLDLSILHATKGRSGLDAVMKAMYEQYYLKEDRGYTRSEFIKMAEKIAGVSLQDIFRYVDVAQPIDYNQYLLYAGLELIDVKKDTEKAFLGLKTVNQGGRIVISSVFRGHGAWNGGLNVDDEIIAVNGDRLGTIDDLDRIIEAAKPNDQLTILISRDGILQQLSVTLTKNDTKSYFIMPLENASPAQIAVRKAWLSL